MSTPIRPTDGRIARARRHGGADPGPALPGLRRLLVSPVARSGEEETHEEAAHRELAEETGLTGVRIGPHIWNRRDVFEWRGGMLDVRERWYLARIPDVVDVDCGWTPRNVKTSPARTDGGRCPQLDMTTELLVPRSLARLVRKP